MTVFTLRGRMVDEAGGPWPGMMIAVVDEDPIKDDLIGLVSTDGDGRFRISFTAEAFNQDFLEAEALPDLYIVASTAHEGALLPVFRRAFPGLRFGGGKEDLGDLRVPCPREVPRPLVGQEALPGASKRARRVAIDQPLLQDAAAEIAPQIEAWTGFRDLLTRVRFEAVDSLGAAQVRIGKRCLGDLISAEIGEQAAAMVDRVASGITGVRMKWMGLVALYDPFEQKIVLDRERLESQGLDGMKMILGHELVHAGQFLAHPELTDAFVALNRQMGEAQGLLTDSDEMGEPDPARCAAAEEAMLRFSCNIEGHATHIESDFLRRTYGCMATLPHASLLQVTTFRIAGLAASLRARFRGQEASASFLEEAARKTLLPYEFGLATYQAMARDGRPAPFDPALRPDPNAKTS